MGTYGGLCGGEMWGESGRVGCIRSRGVGSECGGWWRGSVSGGLWGLDRCGCFGWWVD